MSPDTNERLCRAYFDAFLRQDEAWWQANIAPDFVRHDPGLPFQVRGLAGMRQLAGLLHGAFSEVELPIVHTVAQGDKVLVHLHIKGLHSGDFGGLPPTGRRIDAAVMDLFRLQDGKLVEHWALLDNLTILKQLGVMPG